MLILSRRPLTQNELNQVKDILQQSRCPNESLSNTFDRFTGLVDGKIFFDDAQSDFNDLASLKDFSSITKHINMHPQIILTVI